MPVFAGDAARLRELDELLVRYVVRGLPDWAKPRRNATRSCLLDLPDPELFGYLAGRSPPDGDPMIEDVIARIRQ